MTSLSEPGSTRAPIAVGIGVFMGLIALTAGYGYFSQNDASRNFDRVVIERTQSALVRNMRRDTIELQRNILLYQATGNASLAQRTRELHGDLIRQVRELFEVYEDREFRATLQRMRSHILDYGESFEAVVRDRQRRTELTASAAGRFASIDRRLDELAARPTSASGRAALQAIQLAVLRARAEFLAYLESPDAERIDSARRHLAEAAGPLAQLIADNPAAALELAEVTEDLRRYADEFAGIAAATRGYLHLVNVVMAGAAEEFLYLANRLEEASLERSDALEATTLIEIANSRRAGTAVFIAAMLIGVTLAFVALRSARKIAQTQDALAKSVAYYRAAFEHAAIGVAHVRLDGTWITVNKKLCEIFGYSADELVGGTFQALTDSRDLEEDLHNVERTLRGEIDSYTMEKRYIRKDGAAIWANLSVALIRDSDGRPEHFVSVIEDISERKAIERRLAKHNELLEQRVEERTKELVRSNSELQEFAYAASHDLQEPLRTVVSYIELLERRYADVLDGDGREFMQFAVDGAKRMRGLIEKLLTYSRISRRRSKLESVDAKQTLERVQRDLHAALEAADVTLVAGPLPTIDVDELPFRQILQNLISNSVRYRGNEPCRIEISAKRRPGEWEICVGDNGIGFDPKFAERIFLPFQRLHGVGEYGGSGMGLAIVRKIVESRGGRIWAESQPGAGASFRFTIPDAAPEDSGRLSAAALRAG